MAIVTDTYRSQKPPMAADATVFTDRTPVRVPLDVREWVAPETLRAWVGEVVANLDQSKPEVMEFRRMVPEVHPQMLLSVLLYAYITQLFASAEIVRACNSDPVFRALCSDNPPSSTQLQHFRRKHRVLLEGTLAQVLLRAVREKYAHIPKLPPGVEYSMLTCAVDRIDTSRHMDNIAG